MTIKKGRDQRDPKLDESDRDDTAPSNFIILSRAESLRQLAKTLPGTTAGTQRQRIMAALRTGPLSTVEAIRFLDIIRPSARIAELRNNGHWIITMWRTDATETGEPHRVALYVLKTGGGDAKRA